MRCADRSTINFHLEKCFLIRINEDNVFIEYLKDLMGDIFQALISTNYYQLLHHELHCRINSTRLSYNNQYAAAEISRSVIRRGKKNWSGLSPPPFMMKNWKKKKPCQVCRRKKKTRVAKSYLSGETISSRPVTVYNIIRVITLVVNKNYFCGRPITSYLHKYLFISTKQFKI